MTAQSMSSGRSMEGSSNDEYELVPLKLVHLLLCICLCFL